MAEHDPVAPAPRRAIIRRKITPPALARDLVARPRLSRRITNLVDRGGTLTVYAAAGSGKTTAVAAALQTLDRPTAWLSLDGSEAAAGRLLLYLEAAVETHAPDAQGVATDALAARIPAGEAAGLLAESLHGSGLVLVCDNAERVAGSGEALAVLSALARYAPADVSIVLISRTLLPLDLGSTSELARVSQLSGAELAFDLDEVVAALELTGRGPDAAADTLRLTGGWVAGVLFSQGTAAGAAPDHMRNYLTAHVLADLPPDERRFLVRTSLLDEVTVDAAQALGLDDCAQLLARLRDRHLPVTWTSDRTMIVSPQLRDHLREMLSYEEAAELREIRLRHARLLVQRGEREEGVHALLHIGAVDEAWAQAAELLPGLVERMDFRPAARWLDLLGASSRPPTPAIAAIVLRVAFALEQPGRAVELLDRHGWEWVTALGGCDQPSRDEALVLLTWCLWHAGRVDDAVRVAHHLAPGRARDIAATVLALSLDRPPPPFPAFATTPSGPLDSLLMRLAYIRGRLDGLDSPGMHGPWRSVLGAPWVIAGLRATGRIEQAMVVYEAHRQQSQPLWLHALDATELMLDLGRGADAWDALQRGGELAAATSSEIYASLVLLMEAKVCLRLHKDPEAAIRALDEAEARGAGRHGFTRELAHLWRGLALLLQERHSAAAELLARALESMQRSDRMLDVPTAACYLAEARWHLGDEDGSDAAAELAITVAGERGSMHLLLTALADVPAVAVRGADTEPSRTSRWHDLTARLTGGRHLTLTGRDPRLVLDEFGDPELRLDGSPVIPRLRKSVELLAYLLASDERVATRKELLDALFESRNEAAGRSYLRQALYRLREVLPDEVVPTLDGDRFRLAGPDLVTSATAATLATLAQADHQDGETRLATLAQAIERAERGPYLDGFPGGWAETRRAEISARIRAARLDLARVAFRLGRYREAVANTDAVLRADPFSEQAWMLRISLAQASGQDDQVLAFYRRYVAAMRELSVPPSAEIRRLVTRLRA
ncbi:hypothetical protein GCM10023215_30070 [Pseudonocardia yuanmonensis]|uniref:Bacterial transcriptional activator domain-containing protein n=1 Tax=Pseudonocardia yuanmonensis TaxID=1095914 RepID=A0ABP8WL30_9PSEU